MAAKKTTFIIIEDNSNYINLVFARQKEIGVRIIVGNLREYIFTLEFGNNLKKVKRIIRNNFELLTFDLFFEILR